MMTNAILKAKVIILFSVIIFVKINGQTFTKEHIYELMKPQIEKLTHNEGVFNKGELPENTSPMMRDTEIENNVSQTPTPEAELHAVINPMDTNNMIVAGMIYDPGAIFFVRSVSYPIYYTLDGGDNWQKSEFTGEVSPEGFFSRGGGDPVLAFDADGVAYLAFLIADLELDLNTNTRFHIARSEDGGATWEVMPTLIDEADTGGLTTQGNLTLVDKEWIVADQISETYRNNIYVVYTLFDLTDTTYQILFNKKLAAGNEFMDTPLVLTADNIVFAQFSSIDVDRNGNIHVLFNAAAEDDTLLGMYYTRSDDGGESFSSPVRLSDVEVFNISPGQRDSVMIGVDAPRMYTCQHLRVDKSGGEYDGNVYLTWTANGQETILENGHDIYFMRSTDNGFTWEPPSIINDDGLLYIHQFYSSLAINEEGTVALSWYDRRNDTGNSNTDYYFSRSTDGGNTFSENIKVNGLPTNFNTVGLLNDNFGIGEYVQMIMTPHFAIPFWSDGHDNNGNLEIFMAKIPLGDLITGAPFFEQRSLMADFQVQKIWPNPASSVMNLELFLKQAIPIDMAILDHSGKVVMKHSFGVLSSGENELQLNLNMLPSGDYQCYFSDGRYMVGKPMVIVR